MNENSGRQQAPAPIDTWAVLDFWLRRWSWLAGWTIVLAIAGAYSAHLLWRRTFTATAELVHYEPSDVDDTYRPRDLATPSLIVMLQAPEIYEKVGAQLDPPLTAKEVASRLTLTLDRNNDVATVIANGPDRASTVALVNRFCSVATAYTKDLQRRDAADAGTYVSHQLAEVEAEIASTRATVPASSAGVVAALDRPAAAPADPPDDLPEQIQAARDQLDELLVRYTEEHPLVREQKAKLAVLEDLERKVAATRAAQPAATAGPAASGISPDLYGRLTPEEIALGERFRTLEASRALLIARQRAIQPFRDNPPGYFEVLMPASADRTYQHNHRLEMALCGVLGAFLGFMGSAGQILLGEFMDNRVKTRSDVRRVTGLPLLATLGNMSRLSQSGRELWAFRAWTTLQSRLSLSPNHGMVCGITSAHSGDGRSTWVELLSRAASACGFKVLTITARPTGEPERKPEPRSKAAPNRSVEIAPAPEVETVSLTANALAAPGEIVQRMAGAGAPPVVNIPLPGWVWNLERRKQWLAALEAWREIQNIVIFIELPPASVPETVLLAENIPNLIWLVDSGKSDAAEIQGELETLRDARCNLVGAVLNRERAIPVRGRFSRWFGGNAIAAAIMAAAILLPARAAAGVDDPGANGDESFTVSAPASRASWQQNLTLGPGDIVSLHLYGAPELTRDEVPIGPDGRISYLEASDVMAAGLTIDEFRDRLNEALGRYRRSPQAWVIPVAYHSKKYYVLGTVVQSGAYEFDRPITIVEAVARARGFETGLSAGSTYETTDFALSFLERDGQHMPVDFERLFRQGDLSQNIALEPGDYLYFAAAGSRSIYVLGQVDRPGPVPYSPDASVLSAIASRGGFTPTAWKQRVLVVRGALNHPQTFKVDTAGALTGDAPNLTLEPGDMVYVSNRPWYRAEDLLDEAATAFVEGAVVTWTGIHIGPPGSPVVGP